MSISCTTWGVHSLATSSSFLGEVSRRGDSGGWFQQQMYISVVDMKGKSSMWQLVSGSSLQVSIMSLSATDRTGTIFSGVSLLRSSLWFGEPGWSSPFWGLNLELLPRDFWILESPKHDFLFVYGKKYWRIYVNKACRLFQNNFHYCELIPKCTYAVPLLSIK